MSPQQQQKATNFKLNANNIMTAMIIPIGIGIFWKCIQIYNAVMAQSYIDHAQDKDINDLKTNTVILNASIKLAEEANNEQDKEIFKLQTVTGILPSKDQFKVKK